MVLQDDALHHNRSANSLVRCTLYCNEGRKFVHTLDLAIWSIESIVIEVIESFHRNFKLTILVTDKEAQTMFSQVCCNKRNISLHSDVIFLLGCKSGERLAFTLPTKLLMAWSVRGVLVSTLLRVPIREGKLCLNIVWATRMEAEGFCGKYSLRGD